jgi:hypothetical protein
LKHFYPTLANYVRSPSIDPIVSQHRDHCVLANQRSIRSEVRLHEPQTKGSDWVFGLQVSLLSLQWLHVLTTSLRIRRVKCDETKPFCIKCTSTGRTCEGYTPPPPRKPRTRPPKCDILQMPLDRDVAVGSGTSVPILDSGSIHACYVPRSLDRARCAVDRDERRSLDYYRTRVSKEISGFFDAEIWNTLVLQVGEGEPAVRHAILALSSLYEAGEMSQLLQYPSSNERYKCLMRFAAHEYTKAVSALFNRINTDGPLLEVVMMSCLMSDVGVQQTRGRRLIVLWSVQASLYT